MASINERQTVVARNDLIISLASTINHHVIDTNNVTNPGTWLALQLPLARIPGPSNPCRELHVELTTREVSNNKTCRAHLGLEPSWGSTNLPAAQLVQEPLGFS